MTPPPEAMLWALAGGHYLPRCLQIVAELGVADALGDEPAGTERLAGEIGAHPDALHRMLRLLAAHGVFTVQPEGWTHSELSRFLRTDHPRSMRGFARMMGSEGQWAAAGALSVSARTGKAGVLEAFGQQFWDYYLDHPEEGRVFDDAMTAKSHAELAELRRVLDFSRYGMIADIGGGRGHTLANVLEAAPEARGILFDLPDVIAAAPDHRRIEKQAGSFFTDPLPAADAYILSNILHDWPDPECIAILKAIKQAAPSHAELLIVENLLFEGEGPHPSKVLDIVMLAATGGRERTEGQYDELLRAAGWTLGRVLPTNAPLSVIVAKPN